MDTSNIDIDSCFLNEKLITGSQSFPDDSSLFYITLFWLSMYLFNAYIQWRHIVGLSPSKMEYNSAVLLVYVLSSVQVSS